MDDHGNSSSYTCCQGEQEKISYLLGRIPTSLSSYSSICAVRSQMPSSSSCPISDGDGDGGRKSLDQDFDSLDCESEEGLEVFEESVKPALTRTSGSKRSRAAEVHNMSEKRRRSRINEKMRALQNLIPNSNKTDKASMLDEAIEYLKQLQLQVQILSMRNGLNLQSMYLSGALQPLQTSQMCIGFGLDSDTAMNIATAILPLNQDSAAQSSFVLPNQCAPSHQTTGASSLINVTDPEATLVNSSQSIHGSFQVPVPCEIFAGDMSAPTQLDAVHYTRNLTENERTSIAIDAKQLGVPVSSRIGIDHLEEGMLGTEERSEEMPSDEENFIQHLHGLEKLFKVLIQKNIEISEVARSALLTNTEVFKAKRFRLIHIRSCNYACLF